MFYGRFFKVARTFIRLMTNRYTVVWREEPPEPAVYLCWHLNQHGPMISVAWLPRELHFWAHHALCGTREGQRHFAEYTFPQRCNMPRLLSRLLALPVGAVMAGLCNSAQAVPVYRDKNSFKTLSASLKVLQKGEDIIIFPDIDYTNRQGGRELYDGFLYLERFYYRTTGRHLAFMPLYLDDVERQIIAGPAIRFTGDDFDSEKDAVLNAVFTAISGAKVS